MKYKGKSYISFTNVFKTISSFQTNLTTLSQRPLKPRIICRVEATIKAPWVALKILSNRCKKQHDSLLLNNSTKNESYDKTGSHHHYIYRVGGITESSWEDDWYCGWHKGVRRSDNSRQSGPKSCLEQCVDAGNKENGLDHLCLLFLRIKSKSLHTIQYKLIEEGRLTYPPPIWGTRAVGMRTVVPSMTR